MTWDVKPTELMVAIEGDIVEKRRDAALLALRGLIFRSRVDTGRFRGSWNVTTGSVQNYDSGALGANKAESEGKATANAMNRGLAAIAEANNKPYDVLYLSNNIPYADKLNKMDRFLEIVFNDIRVKFG